MTEPPPTNRPRISLSKLGFAIALGVGVGAGVGASSHDPIIGFGVGAAIFIIMLFFEQFNKRKQ